MRKKDRKKLKKLCKRGEEYLPNALRAIEEKKGDEEIVTLAIQDGTLANFIYLALTHNLLSILRDIFEFASAEALSGCPYCIFKDVTQFVEIEENETRNKIEHKTFIKQRLEKIVLELAQEDEPLIPATATG